MRRHAVMENDRRRSWKVAEYFFMKKERELCDDSVDGDIDETSWC